MDQQVKYLLQESELPRQWYNVIPDLPAPPPPPLHPGTHEPVGPDDLAPLFPMALIEQEVSPERYIAIPEPVLDVYRLWRPTPLFRARRLEKDLGTPARIYYKYEGVSPAGSHKPNTAVPQAYYNAAEGVTKLTTETGAGQWGSALAFACALFGLECEVWMVRASYDQKPYRRAADGDLRGDGPPQPVRRHLGRPRGARRAPGLAPAASASRSARRSRWPPPTRPPGTRSAACSTTCCCTRPSSARRRSRSWPRPATPQTSSSAAPAAGPTSPAWSSRSCARSWPAR